MNSNSTKIQEITQMLAHQRRFVVEHGSCPMCETELKISHDIDKNEQKVKEVAYCSQCQLRARSISYRIH